METESTLLSNKTVNYDEDDMLHVRTFVASYLGLVMLASITLNGTICMLFYRKRQLLTVANSFVLNLTACQLGLTFIIIPCVMASLISQRWLLSDFWCQMQAYIFTILTTALQLSLFVISLDRNYAITNSLRYPYIFSPRLCVILLILTWFVGFILGIPSLVNHGQYGYVPSRFMCDLQWNSTKEYTIIYLLIAYCLPFVGQVGCYACIFKAAIRHARQTNRVYPASPSGVQRQSDASSDTNNYKFVGDFISNEIGRSIFSSNSTDSQVGQTQVFISSRTKYKAVKTLLVILISYVISWFGNFVRAVMSLLEIRIPISVDISSMCFLFLSCIFSPIVFAFMNKSIRYELAKFLNRPDSLTSDIPDIHENGELLSNAGLTSISSGRFQNNVLGLPSQTRQSNTSANTSTSKPIQMVTIHEVSEQDGVLSNDRTRGKAICNDGTNFINLPVIHTIQSNLS